MQQQATRLRSDIGDILQRLESLLQALRVVTVAREDERRDDATSASMFLISEIEVNIMTLEMELKGPEIFEPANDDALEPAADDDQESAVVPEVSADPYDTETEADPDKNSSTELTENV